MYTNYNSSLEKNQMMTPPIIGLTSSIVNDKLSNISLEDNSTGLFKIDNSTIKPIVEMPIETNNFIISGTDDEIDSNENNAVNKRYLINKITPLDNKFMTQAQCDNRYLKNDITSLNLDELNINNTSNHNLKISSVTETDVTNPFITFSHNDGNTNHYLMYMNRDRVYTPKPLALSYSTGIDFNTSQKGIAVKADYPKTNLKNLVTSTITQTQINKLASDKYLDNVCPTYAYCNNTYLKQSSYSRLTRTIIYPLEESKAHYEITGIGNQSKNYNNYSSVYEITLPTIKGDLKIVKVRFAVWSTVKEEMEDLHCRISDQSDTVNRRFDGDTKTGSYIHPVPGNNETHYKYVFHFENIFYGSLPKLYLDFFNTTIDPTVNPQIIYSPLKSNSHQTFKVEIISI